MKTYRIIGIFFTAALLLWVGALFWSWRNPVYFPLESTKHRTDSLKQETTGPARTAQSIAPDPTVVVESATKAPDQEPAQADSPIAAFRDWAKAYLAAPPDLRKTLLPQGAELAKSHTLAIAGMIRTDPRQAIENAVPMVVRQDLPDSIVRQLETRVRMKAALNVYGNAPLPGAETTPEFKPYTRSVTKPDGSSWNAYVYGKRSVQRTLSAASIIGISVDQDMAVADSPVRQLESGERPEADGREIVEVCPVSQKETVVERTETGALPPVNEETPAFETGERIVYVCSGGHISQVVEKLSAEEERQHWESLGVTLNAGAGSGAPSDPLSGTIPSGWTTGPRSFLYIRVTFPDHRIDPQSEAECQDSLRQMADYITQTSYGRCYFTYAVAPLIVLPYPESWYVQYQADGSGADSVIVNQARTIAKEMGYDYLTYDFDAVRWNGSVGSYGGSASVGGRGMRLKTNSVGTFCHELGHNLGVWHANFWRTTPPSFIGPGNNLEYGNSFDVMGGSGSLAQYTAHFKNILSWLPNETHWTVNGPGTYRLYQFDSSIADPSFRYALRIKKDAEREYWAEFRQRLTTNTGFTNGLMMTWDGWGQGGIGGSGGSPPNGSNRGAQLLDMTPGSFGNGITDTRNDSALWVGRTFSDDDSGIHITPVAKNTGNTPPSMDVYVSTGSIPGNLPPTLSITASNTTPSAGGSITLTATASDPNGDPLAYAWVFNDGTYSTNNNPLQTKSWSTAGYYQVLCTASDMKGKRTTRSILITVGTPATFRVSGNITGPDGMPLEGVYVANYASSNNTSHTNSSTFCGSWTDSDGNYTITGLTAGSYTITPTLYPNVFTASGFTNPVTVGPNTTGKNFTCTTLPTVTITAIDPVANEGAVPGTGTIRLERTGSTASALSVQIFNTNTGSATKTSDYTLSPAATASTNDGGNGTSQYDIPAGAAFLDITVTPVNDSSAEGIEYAALNFSNTSGGYVLAGPAVGIVEIVDDENQNLQVVKLTQLDNVASETSPDTAILKLERNGSTATALTVNLTLTGTGTNVTDYAIPTSVVIPANSSSVTFALTPVDDAAQEGVETAIVTIATNATYARDSLSNSQTVMIYDNDLPTLTVTASDSSAAEAPGNPGTFTITRTGGNPYLALTVDYSLAGRAVHGVDYRRLDGRAIIPAGAASTTVEIYPFDDTVDEGTQDVILQLRSTTSYAIGGTGIATVTITDNDDPQVYVKLITSGVTEPATGSVTAIAFQIIRPASGTAITVNYAISGTATSGVDFTALPGTIAFASGDTSKTINVSALADSDFEDAETVTLTILPGTGYTVMASQDPSATGVILDGDQPTLDVSAADTTSTLTTQGTETTANLRFIISRKASTAADLVVNYTMAGTATEGVDYTGTTGTATILANTTSAYVTIIPVNDTIPEGIESIVMNLTPAPGTYGLRTPSATMLLGDNDAFASGTVGFASSSSNVAESIGTHNVAVNLTGVPAGDVTVAYHVSSGTATGSGYDFTLADGVLTFPAGTTSLGIPITIYQDIIPEPAETFVLQLYNATGGNLGTSTHTVTINNLSAPEAFTDATTNLLATSATLNGRVLPNAVATDAWFEYGPTTTYGSTTTLQSIGSGTTSVSVNAPISGFVPGSYHFRCVAQNSAGISYGIDQVISSSNADLANLVPNAATLSPAFGAATLTYTATVPNATSSLTITPTPTLAQANATVKVNGTSVASGTPSVAIPLAVGLTPITVLVTAQDGTTTLTYSLSVTRLPSTNADLAGLIPSAGALSPTFGAATLAYTAIVPNATSSLTINPTLAQINATVKVNGTSVASGTPSAAIPLAVGTTPITVLVTAQDGTTTKTYTLNVTRLPSSNADLAGLVPTTGTLSPAFSAATLAYTATVPNATTSLTITPTLAQINATVKVNGTSVTSGTPSAAIPLAVGITPITVLVTAQDGTTTKTYTLNVTRLPSSNANLAGLIPSTATLSPAFSAATLTYTATVPNATSSLTITPTLAQINATVKVNGTSVASGTPSAAIPLAVGITPITVLLTAQDGTTTKTYSLSVTRLPSGNADLTALTISTGTLSPVFSANAIAFTASVANETTSITVTPVVTEANATVQVNGINVISGTPSNPISLSVGVTSIATAITAQDGTTTKTYTVNVTRLPSSNADLAGLTPSAGTLSPAFSASTIDYTATVSNATTSVDFTPTVAQLNATAAINGTTVASGSASNAIPLNVGDNPITTTVTAQDGTTTKTYTLIITRLPSTNADLADLAPGAGTLSPAFETATLAYTANVSNATTSLTITPTLAQMNAAVKVNGNPAVSGTPSEAIPLAVGITPISILVTAQDGATTKTYTLNVTRAPSANADLADLVPGAGTLSPAFDVATLAYTTNVSNSTVSLTITPTLAQSNAAVKVNGTSVVSGTPSEATPLAVGITPIYILVTAQDEATTKTYTLNVNRAPSANADLASLEASTGPLSPAFNASITDYTATVSNATDSVSVTPAVAQANATIKVNGNTVASGTLNGAIPLAAGITPIEILVTAQDGTTTQTYTLHITREPLPFAQWQNSFFGSEEVPDADPGADPDSDGIVNLMEYVLGGIPSGPGASDTSILPTCVKTENSLVFTFHRNKTAAQEFSTVIESTSDLSQPAWPPVANENVTVESINATTDLVTATIPHGPETGRRFVRLRVQTNP